MHPNYQKPVATNLKRLKISEEEIEVSAVVNTRSTLLCVCVLSLFIRQESIQLVIKYENKKSQVHLTVDLSGVLPLHFECKHILVDCVTFLWIYGTCLFLFLCPIITSIISIYRMFSLTRTHVV